MPHDCETYIITSGTQISTQKSLTLLQVYHETKVKRMPTPLRKQKADETNERTEFQLRHTPGYLL